MSELGPVLSAAVASGRIPGAVAAAGRGPVTLGTWALGHADTTPGSRRAMTPGTVFDLASLTKVVATTTMALALVTAGSLGLDDPAGRYLPAARWEVTVRQLLSHTSGLPASVNFYEWCANRSDVLDALFATPLEAPPGTRVAYSDLGFMTLGEIIGAVTGGTLDEVFRELVSEPLGLTDTDFLPSGPPSRFDRPSSRAGSPSSRFAATEFREDGTPWTGVVHDENARVMGGVAGHAGLFGTVADLARFAAWWVSPSDSGPVPAALRREAERCQTRGLPGDGGLPGRRGLGWVLPGDRFDILGGAGADAGLGADAEAGGVGGAGFGVGGTWPPSAVSHTGFTGTSLALDPASGAWVVLLTNSVHVTRDPSAIRSLRRTLHTAAARTLFPAPAG